MKYVLGFAFDSYLTWVLLINKTKPDWQKGLLNGVGGKVEEGEHELRAMTREFEEETGHVVAMTEWKQFARLQYGITKPSPPYEPDIVVHCYTAVVKQFSPRKDNPNGEVARWRSVDTAYEPNYIPNLRWLIPLALLKHKRPEWEEQGTVILL
jgi:8-oxo-dGTP diphosphatase